MMKKVLISVISASLIVSAVLPVFAQETTNQGEDILPIRVLVTGPITYEDVTENAGLEILIGGVVVIPLPGFDVSAYPAGKNMTVIGDLTANDEIMALSIFDAGEEIVEVTPPPIPTQAPVVESDNEVLTAPGQRRGQGQGRGNNREVVEISGAITSVSPNAIVVDGVEIEGGNVFRPREMEVGQEVIVTGTFKNNGRLRTISIEIEGEPVVANDEEEFIPCLPETHILARIIADEFDLEPLDILKMYCNGNSFGDVARALLLSKATGQDPTIYLEQFNDGADWLTIINNAGYEPWTIAPDHVLEVDESNNG